LAPPLKPVERSIADSRPAFNPSAVCYAIYSAIITPNMQFHYAADKQHVMDKHQQRRTFIWVQSCANLPNVGAITSSSSNSARSHHMPSTSVNSAILEL
jgi:hypothetical protein